MGDLISWVQPAIIIALILFVWRDTNRKFERMDDKINCLSDKISALTEHLAKVEVACAALIPRMGRPFGMAGIDPLAPRDTDKQDEEAEGDDNEETE